MMYPSHTQILLWKGTCERHPVMGCGHWEATREEKYPRSDPIGTRQGPLCSVVGQLISHASVIEHRKGTWLSSEAVLVRGNRHRGRAEESEPSDDVLGEKSIFAQNSSIKCPHTTDQNNRTRWFQLYGRNKFAKIDSWKLVYTIKWHALSKTNHYGTRTWRSKLTRLTKVESEEFSFFEQSKAEELLSFSSGQGSMNGMEGNVKSCNPLIICSVMNPCK